MKQWLRGKTLFQKVAMALMLLLVSAAIVSYCSGRTSTAEFVPLALILCYIAFRKELLWRIRNRLLLTPFRFAVVPIVLVGWALIITTELLPGQFATQRVHQDLEMRIETVGGSAQNLTLAASLCAKADLIVNALRCKRVLPKPRELASFQLQNSRFAMVSQYTF
jgi:hypothetical protein